MAMDSDERAVREAHADWITAVNAGELERLMGLMTDDVVLINPGQAPFGREGFQAGFTGGHREFELHCASDPQNVVVAGDVAYTCSHDVLTLTPRAGGATFKMAGYRLTVYRREHDSNGDGVWRLARDAHTLAPVAG
jgi:uncharacterized protein (TIGR02246 family)